VTTINPNIETERQDVMPRLYVQSSPKLLTIRQKTGPCKFSVH